MSTELPVPPVDAELSSVLTSILETFPPTITPDLIPTLRAGGLSPTADQLIEGRPIEYETRTIPGPLGQPELTISIFRRTDHAAPGPAIFFTHLGGLIFGDRFEGIAPIIDYVESIDAVVVTVEYRLAPENPAPAAAEDSYAALVWTVEHATELGFDPQRLIVAGNSAGGALAAALTLMSRDRGTPKLAGSLLMYASLDVRNNSVSSRQIDLLGIWDHGSNETAWNAWLGDRRKSATVTAYESPSLAHDLSGLPPTYLEVGSYETFRDEVVAYASSIWSAGGDADLHVWAGGFHMFEIFAPDAKLSITAKATRDAWIQRVIG